MAALVVLPVGSVATATDATTTTNSTPSGAECEDLAKKLIVEFEAKAADMRQRAKAFQDRQAAEREAYGSQPHTAEEFKAFSARQADEARQFYTALWSEFVHATEAMMDTYRSHCGSYEANALRSWQRPEPPVPYEYRTSNASPQPAYSEPSTQPAQPPTCPDGYAPAEPAPSGGSTSASPTPTTACAPPPSRQPSPECQGYEQELRAQMEQFLQAIAEEKEAFAGMQAREREAFASQEHTDEERKAFAERQAMAALQKQEEWAARVHAKEEELKKLYFSKCPRPEYPQGAQPAPAEPAPECAGKIAAWEQARIAFEEQLRAKRAAFEAAWRQRWEQTGSSGASDEEMAKFKQEFTAAQVAMEEEMRHLMEAWHREHPPPRECWGGGGIVVQPACDPERMRLEAREFERHLSERYLGTTADFAEFHAMMEAKTQALAAEWKERRAAFAAQEHTAEEWAKFDADEKAAWDAFHAAMELERQRFEERARAPGQEIQAKIRAEMEQFLRTQAERCFGAHTSASTAMPGQPRPTSPPPPSSGYEARAVQVRMAYDELEQRRVRCVLEARIQFQELDAQQLRELRDFLAADHGSEALARFEAMQLEARKAFEGRAMKLRADCEELLRAQHDKVVMDAHEGSAPWERMGSFSVQPDPAKGEVSVRGKHVAFQGDMATEAIYGYTVDGQLFLDAIRKEARFQSFDIEDERGSSVMVIRGEGLVYRFHDNPAGVANFRVKGGTIELDVADYLKVTVTPEGVELADGDRRAVIVGDGLKVDGDRVVVTDHANFLVKEHRQEVLEKVANRHRGDIVKAVTEKKVGAEVTVVAGKDGLATEELDYEDMDIAVAKPRPNVVSVRIDSPGGEGKTVVLNVEKGLLADLANVLVSIYEVESGKERDAKATKASSLADVLDPTDDEGPEYWIVTDEDGVQVLVSFPHFSEKRVEIQSGSSGTKLVPGFEALGLLAALGAAVLAARRRA